MYNVVSRFGYSIQKEIKVDQKQSEQITLNEMLTYPYTVDFKVLAGEKGLQAVVTGANIMDNPKALDWFTPGEVLITSGFFLTNDPIVQKEQLQQFKNLNLSGIFVKTLTFFDVIPQSLIDLCDEMGIPLIEIPYGITFSGLLTKILGSLSTHQKDDKQLAIDSHNRFFKTTLTGGGVKMIVDDLSTLTDNTIVLVDSEWNVIEYNKISDEDIKFFTVSDESIQFDKEAFEEFPPKVSEIRHIIHRNFKKMGQGIDCGIMPIYFNTVNYGYIIVISSYKKLTSSDHIVLESASMALALQISQQVEADRNSNRVIREFFKDLLSGHKVDANLLNSIGIDVDYNDSYAFITMNVKIEYGAELSLMQRQQIDTGVMKTILEDTKRFTRDTNIELQVFKQGNKIFGIYKQNPKASNVEQRSETSAFFKQLIEFLNMRIASPHHISVMVGSYQPLSKLRTSYEESIRIMSFPLDPNQIVFFFNDFYLELFLTEHIGVEAEKDFYEHYLKPLILYDESINSDLVNTLRTYLKLQYNVADTSRKLFIHRNTMLYRLTKIQEILNYDINDPKVNLALRLAFHFYDKIPLVNNLI